MELTAQQQRVVDTAGDFLLLACPGSGKTRSSAARAAAQINAGRKVALCSYTNVGADRITAVLCDGMGVVPGPAHFTGTLHGFLLRYVLYPFGHLAAMRRAPQIRITGWPDVSVFDDYAKRIPLDRFRRDSKGGLVLTWKPHTVPEPAAEIIADVGELVRQRKLDFLRGGVVSADDAMWVCLWLLRKHDWLARAVGGRFDELLLDEAQDTSELQLACVDLLKGTGRLKSLVLVGDLEQSIFSFQGASAEGCRRLARDRGMATLSLTQNHRCSQLICDIAVHFCEREEPDEAVGQHAQCGIKPEVVLYDPTDPTSSVEIYRQRLEIHGIEASRAAVLARTNDLAAEINGQQDPVTIEARPRALGHACAALRESTMTRREIQAADAIVAYCAFDATPDELDPAQQEVVRSAAYRLLGRLPVLDMDLRGWIKAAAHELDTAVKEFVDRPVRSGGRTLRSRANQEGYVARDVFAPVPADLRAQTIHDIKGEDREAVMVVIDRPRRKFAPQASLWEAAIAGGPLDSEDAEEKRVAFVALTRAERYSVVALPGDESGSSAASTFEAAGFSQVQ